MERGLCFPCKEKFAPGHGCKLDTFLLLEFSNDNEHLVDREVEANENEYKEGINQQDMAEISFHAILSKTSGTTMKVEGTLEGRKVLTLVDSGSTHNFISASLVKQLELKICRGLSLVLPGLKTTEDFFPFSMRGVDLVLGIKWLASLNTVQANWNEMFINFYVNRKKYKLQGVPSVAKTDVSLQSYSKLPHATSDSSLPRVEIPAYTGKEIQGAYALLKRPQHPDFLALAGQYPQFCLEDKASFQRGKALLTANSTMSFFRAYLNSPVGPKTTHFWGPVANFGFVAALSRWAKGQGYLQLKEDKTPSTELHIVLFSLFGFYTIQLGLYIPSFSLSTYAAQAMWDKPNFYLPIPSKYFISICKTRTFALGDKPHSFFAPERKPPQRGLNPRPLACGNNLLKVTLGGHLS
nr:retrotransposon Gag domain, retroviral aspartyl protease [Tanacetum cinerariifolium]